MNQYWFYVFNGEVYFYGWNNWSMMGDFLCPYEDAIETMIRKSKFKKNELYAFCLNENDEENLSFFVDEVKKDRIKEVKRIAAEVRQFNEPDKEIIANRLDELAKKLGGI